MKKQIKTPIKYEPPKIISKRSLENITLSSTNACDHHGQGKPPWCP